MPAIDCRQVVVAEAARLIQAARLLRVPVFVTEQYPRGLGRTVPEIAEALADIQPREKLAFSACEAEGLVTELRERSIADVVLCGIETHVCVCQSALDLLDASMRVFVAADAVSSRTAANREAGLDRMRSAGATVVSTEMVIFEWLERAGTDEFKQVLKLVR